MSRHFQEDEMEFRYTGGDTKYPSIRSVVVRTYGGTLEDAISRARERFNLDYKWELISGNLAK